MPFDEFSINCRYHIVVPFYDYCVHIDNPQEDMNTNCKQENCPLYQKKENTDENR